MNEHVAGEILAAYMDGALKDERKTGVEAHLARCRECREALAEVADIQGSRARIPDEFLRRALKTVPPRSGAVLAEGAPEGKGILANKALFLRPAFGIAAVFLVVILIGYFYLGHGRVETPRPDEKEMQAHTVPLDSGRSAVKTKEAVPAYEEVTERAVQAQDEKVRKEEAWEGRSGAGSGLKAEKQLAVKGAGPEPLPAIPSRKKAAPVTVLAEEELSQAVDKADMNQPAAKQGAVIGGAVDGVEAPLEKDKASGTKLAASESAATQPIVSPARAKGSAVNEMKQYRSQPAGAAAGAMQFFLAATGRAAAPLTFGAEAVPPRADGAAPPHVDGAAPPRSLVCIEGDVAPDDLLNPKQLGELEWLPEGLTLELEIAADGTVVVVTPLGDWDAAAVAKAKAAAKELAFSASTRKIRRAVLSVLNGPN